MNARLDEALGDPLAPGALLNPAAVLAADERHEPFTAADAVLRAHLPLDAFIPRSGDGPPIPPGRLMEMGRSVFRHDAGLAARHGIPGLAAALDLWTAVGTLPSSGHVERLLAGATVVVGGGTYLHGSSTGPLLSGEARLLGTAHDGLAVLSVRTEEGLRGRLLMDLARLDPGRSSLGPEQELSGLRGCTLRKLTFQDCPLPADTTLDVPLRGAFTQALLPAMAIGTLDTQLRVVLRFARERVIYGRPVAEIPHSRSLLVNVFLDLLICDCLTGMATEPASTAELVPALLRNAGNELSMLLGARSYLREGDYGIFQKHRRDLSVLLALGFIPPAPAHPVHTILDLPVPEQLESLRTLFKGMDSDKRYGAVTAAAAACLTVWHTHRGEPFLGETDWLAGAWRRLATRLGRHPRPLADEARDRIFAELIRRADHRETFDLAGRPFTG